MTLPTPRGVLFDFGDTLAREGPVNVRAGAAAVLEHATGGERTSPDELAADMVRLMADLDPRRRASQMELPLHTVWSLIYEPRGIQFTLSQPEIEWVYWSAATSWTPMPGARDVLEYLATAAVPVGVVSNTMFRAEIIARQLAISGLDGVVPWIITSAEHVVRKPHPRLFELASRRLAVRPQETWFVGDSFECDVEGAATAGMVPIWFSPDGASRGGFEPAAGAVRNWHEFLELLRPALNR